jgi:uncharacterized membrane protein YfcA
MAAALEGGAYGNVSVSKGLILSAPAVVGVVLGTAVQQRIPERTVSLLFAGLLVVAAITLLVP